MIWQELLLYLTCVVPYCSCGIYKYTHYTCIVIFYRDTTRHICLMKVRFSHMCVLFSDTFHNSIHVTLSHDTVHDVSTHWTPRCLKGLQDWIHLFYMGRRNQLASPVLPRRSAQDSAAWHICAMPTSGHEFNYYYIPVINWVWLVPWAVNI